MGRGERALEFDVGLGEVVDLRCSHGAVGVVIEESLALLDDGEEAVRAGAAKPGVASARPGTARASAAVLNFNMIFCPFQSLAE